SPALVAAARPAEPPAGEQATRSTTSAVASPALESPARAAVLEALETTEMIGMIEQPLFRELLGRTQEERRRLVCDLASRRPPPPIGQKAFILVVTLLAHSDLLESGEDVAELLAYEKFLPIAQLLSQLERFAAKGALPRA